MKTNYTRFLIVALAMIWTSSVNSQCANNNYQYGSISNLAPGASATIYCMYGGEYALVNVVNGASYTFSTCGGSWDTQLTLYSNSGGSSLAYNDDYCSLQSQISWTASFTGQVRVVLDKWPCNSYNSCMNMTVTRAAVIATNPCQSSIALNCNQSYQYSLASGSGSWNPSSGPWGTPGNEQVIEFTATVSGVHSIGVTHPSSGWVDLFIKSGSCNANGWSYIDDISSSATNYVTLNAGTTYYFLIDDENNSASSGNFSITCPDPAVNPCNNITPLTCGVTSYTTLSAGSGAWNPPGPWGTPGKEKVFSYTAPTSGSYPITVTNNSGWVDLFYKGGSCGPTGWTYLSDISYNETNSVNLIGGVTYYFLIDDENTSASSVSINIACPCVPPAGGIDNSIVVTSNSSYASTTVGSCDDCSYRSSNDRVLEMEITCEGDYTISTCGGASWDTYLYLSTAPCGGTLLSYNDDNCGLQSSISSFLTPGTYYVTIEGYSSLSQGAFNLSITKECDLSATIIADENDCGYNISCNGLNDGEAAALVSGACGDINYNWSNGAQTISNTGIGAGYYSLSVADDWGCVASASITLTEPNLLTVNAGNDQTVYYGYTPLSCADLSGTANGGCAEYLYSWSANGSDVAMANSTSVCPSVSTDYTLTVSDQNGCMASNDVHICVIDVTCFAGNSGNQKVEMCHTPPGNPDNAHTICINESAVEAHLAHGCSLGSCDEQNDCSIDPLASIQVRNIESSIELIVSPNPFADNITVELTSRQNRVFQVVLVNSYGQEIQKVFKGNLNTSEINRSTINTQELGSGIYFLKTSDSDGAVVMTKIIKI